jgi:ATP-dependent Clp protease ATP-binding subunit ClpX
MKLPVFYSPYGTQTVFSPRFQGITPFNFEAELFLIGNNITKQPIFFSHINRFAMRTYFTYHPIDPKTNKKTGASRLPLAPYGLMKMHSDTALTAEEEKSVLAAAYQMANKEQENAEDMEQEMNEAESDNLEYDAEDLDEDAENRVFDPEDWDNDIDWLHEADSPQNDKEEKQDLKYHSPREMADEVKKYVVGQDEAIEQMAVIIYQHYLWVKTGKPNMVKSCAVLIGETGVGKTEILRRYAEIIDCPFIRINSAEFVPNGWKGNTLSAVIGSYLNKYTERELEKAIIMFSEIDKIVHHKTSERSDKSADYDMDVSREIMKFADEDTTMQISGEFSSHSIRVSGIQILLDGAFYGLSDIIKRRVNKKEKELYQKSNKHEEDNYYLPQVCSQDLLDYGFPPELLSRIGMYIVLNKPDATFIKNVLTYAKDNVLERHIAFCKDHGIELSFSDDAIMAICQICANSMLGVRYANTIVTEILNTVYYTILDASDTTNAEPKKVTITSAMVKEKLKHLT